MHHPSSRKISGFTIVEVLVVIVVLGILAAIVTVSIGSWRTRVAETEVRSDLNSVAAAMDSERNFKNGYPTNPIFDGTGAIFQQSGGVLITYESGSIKDYCIQATSSVKSAIKYHITNENKTPVLGSCGGRTIPAVPGEIIAWKNIYAGYGHTCAISTAGTAYCWGLNTSGQLGNGAKVSVATPAPVDMTGVLAGKTIVSMSTGRDFTCALASDDKVYCWGSGTLGDGTGGSSTTPVAVSLPGKTVKMLGEGRSSAICLVASDDKVYCWGNNTDGAAGGLSAGEIVKPTAVAIEGALAGKAVSRVATGQSHSCAVTMDGRLYCWGVGSWSVLGDGGNISGRPSYHPALAVDMTGVLNGKAIKDISIGATHTCVSTADGQMACWGHSSTFGGTSKLGNGTTSGSVNVPTAVSMNGALSGRTIASISLGWYGSCTVASDNAVYCWGYNAQGQLGDGLTSNASIPIAVSQSGLLAGQVMKAVSGGYAHTCGLNSAGTAYCWGASASGRLGIPEASSPSAPVLPVLVTQVLYP